MPRMPFPPTWPPHGVFTPEGWHWAGCGIRQERAMSEQNSVEGLAEYRVKLNRAVVLRLRERAARESRLTGEDVTWVELLRAAAEAAAEGGQQ